jgi:hypothetical protein
MKLKIFALIFLTFAVQSTFGQENMPPKPTETPKVYEPKFSDVGSLDGIMKAVYDAISGDAGQKRDWDRFRSLFHADARLIPTSQNSTTKVFNAKAFTPEEYIKRAEPVFAKDGFFESEFARTMEEYGNIVHVFSSYEARRKKDDKAPFLRGINSFQLLFDGKRWWVMTIYWQAETPENPIPKQYLKNGKAKK